MTQTRLPDFHATPDAFVASVTDRLEAGRSVRRVVPGGWLHIDRPLPFLCVYRHPAEDTVEGAERLVLSQAAHLSVSGGPEAAATVGDLVQEVARTLAGRFGSFLVVELWPAPGGGVFRIHAPPTEPATTAATLADALSHVDFLAAPPRVETVDSPAPAPPGLPSLLSPDQQRSLGVLLLGLEVPTFFLSHAGRPYPRVLRQLQRDLARAVQQTVFEFTTVQTSFRAEDFRALGQRRLLRATREADRRLAEVAGDVDYLLAVTPVNTNDAWEAFRQDGCRRDPTFRYRPLPVDPDLLKRSLYAVAVEGVEDPTLAALFRAKRHEIDRQVSLLEDRGSAAFLHTSLQLYEPVDDRLLGLAEELLCRTRPGERAAQCASDSVRCIDAHTFARRAQAELDHYRAVDPELDTTVTVRADVPGVVVSRGHLLVGSRVRIAESRADALVQHEVGTHLVTEANGRAQPLRQLRIGLPGYEETQEALAVLAEFMAGGLTAPRLATLAARVVAVHRLVKGATFTETFRHLHHHHGLGAGRAFHIAMRVYRGSGLTKDALYLRGLDRLLRYLAEGNPLEPLLVGKLPLQYVPVVQELQWRGVLSPPRLQPRWLAAPGAAARIDAVRAGLGVLDLVPGAAG